MKYVLALQVHQGDAELASSLCSLISDLESAFHSDVGFLFSWKRGMKRLVGAVQDISKRFPVLEYFGKNHVEGWPYGPNTQWVETVGHVVSLVKAGLINTKAIFTFEPDCTPVKLNWWKNIFDEFEQLSLTPTKHGNPCLFVGHWTEPPEFTCHINGNLVLSTKFDRYVPEIANSVSTHAWDVFWAPKIIPYAKPSMEIYNDYRRRPHGGEEVWEFTKEELFGPKYRPVNNPLHGVELRPSFIHGTKKIQAHDLVRSVLLG